MHALRHEPKMSRGVWSQGGSPVSSKKDPENRVTLTALALSVKSNCSFFSSPRPPKPNSSNSPHFKSVKLLNLSSSGLDPRVPKSISRKDDVLDAVEIEELREGAVMVEDVELGPMSGWKVDGKTIRFLYASEYLGGNLRVGGEIRSHSFETAKERLAAGDTEP